MRVIDRFLPKSFHDIGQIENKLSQKNSFKF